MSDNINKMDFKQLRNEVQLLRDELAIMKRKYEDVIYNLDTDNFSSRFVKEQGDMRTAIKVTAEGIETKVSNEEFESTKTQLANKIESEVKTLGDADKELSTKITQTADTIRSEVKSATETLDGKFENYSTIEHTAKEISSAVNSVNETTDSKLENYSTIEQTDQKISAKVTETKEYAEGYVTDVLANGDYVTSATLKSQLDISADGIYTTVAGKYETKTDANASYSSLRSSISSVSIEADNISSRVEQVEDGKFGNHTLFRQTSDTFLFDGAKTVFTGCVYLTDNDDNKAFSIFLNEDASSYDALYMWGYGAYTNVPIIIGSTSGAGVYIGNYTDDDRVATREWVRDNAGGSSGTVVAVFG